MTLGQHEIAEAAHRILNPFTEDKLMLLGEVCRLRPGQRQLDLACGKGEMLCRWADRFPALGLGPDLFTSLAGTLDRFTAAGTELVEMVLADGDSWDRYAAGQWWTVERWLRANPDHPDAPGMREFLDTGRRSHLAYGRRYLGWGVFVLRPAWK